MKSAMQNPTNSTTKQTPHISTQTKAHTKTTTTILTLITILTLTTQTTHAQNIQWTQLHPARSIHQHHNTNTHQHILIEHTPNPGEIRISTDQAQSFTTHQIPTNGAHLVTVSPGMNLTDYQYPQWAATDTEGMIHYNLTNPQAQNPRLTGTWTESIQQAFAGTIYLIAPGNTTHPYNILMENEQFNTSLSFPHLNTEPAQTLSFTLLISQFHDYHTFLTHTLFIGENDNAGIITAIENNTILPNDPSFDALQPLPPLKTIHQQQNGNTLIFGNEGTIISLNPQTQQWTLADIQGDPSTHFTLATSDQGRFQEAITLADHEGNLHKYTNTTLTQYQGPQPNQTPIPLTSLVTIACDTYLAVTTDGMLYQGIIDSDMDGNPDGCDPFPASPTSLETWINTHTILDFVELVNL